MKCARGMILIDVLAALAILGGTVVTLLLAQSRALQQATALRRQATAATLAHELLVDWRLKDIDVRVNDTSVCNSLAGWSWRRSAGATLVADSIEMMQITLDIIYAEPAASPPIIATYRWLELPSDADAR